jgi:hypothetical protein
VRSRIASFVLLLLGVGCVNEYHPDYHPVSSYTYVQNISYPTVIVENARTSSVRHASPSSGAARSASPLLKGTAELPQAVANRETISSSTPP